MPTSPLIVVYAPLALAFLFFCLACSVFLVARAVKTRLYHIIYLSAYFLLTFFYFILVFFTYIDDFTFWWQRISIYQVAVIANLLFIQRVFYGKGRSPFRYIIAVILALVVINITTAIVRDVFDGGFADLVVGRVILTIGGSTELAIVTGWQSIVSFTAYKKYKGASIEPHVRTRYLLFGSSGVILFIFATIDVPATIIALAATYDYYIIETISIALILVYSVLNFLTWVMPGWLKRFLNRHYTPRDAEPTFTEGEIMKQLEDSSG
jgi:hypothetical protein